MSIFQYDETAWSAWTKAIENVMSDPGPPAIVQSPTVLAPLAARPPVHPKLGWYRRLRYADTVPLYGRRNARSYFGTLGNTVGLSYQQYLGDLNREVVTRFVNPAEQPEINSAERRYVNAQRAYTSFERDAATDWKIKKRLNPNLTRAEWDRDYGSMGYTPEKNLLSREKNQAYGRYIQLSQPYPQVARVANAYAKLDTAAGTSIRLPQSEDEIPFGEEAWDSFFRTNIDLGVDWADFWNSDVQQDMRLEASSSTSTHYEHRWSASGGARYGFFRVSGGASGGTVESHLRAGTQKLKFSFKRLVPGNVVRGTWFDGGLVQALPYRKYVDHDSYWGPNGVLPLIPVTVLIGRGLSIEIETSQRAYDEYRSWRQTHGGGSFSIGGFSIGASGNSSTSWNSVTDNSAGTAIKLTDNSNEAYMVGLVSVKMEDLPRFAAFEHEAEEWLKRAKKEEADWVKRRGALQDA
jgi:hypothetical protein